MAELIAATDRSAGADDLASEVFTPDDHGYPVVAPAPVPSAAVAAAHAAERDYPEWAVLLREVTVAAAWEGQR
ncbi:hypothetical protein [Parafrankia sp. EUN1f]|uniref:hypothetical protein n=1 Tax=Parafrankia sp. EUN1f TaxID=102897 RepID=UPI0001C43DF0|nr:hypothetical protein [Parafrankia sp. EUN1f]EFC85758.1 hypothetical protein FrEUN1fDRAFT_1077 [Parafrankia sp. EUN1f]